MNFTFLTTQELAERLPYSARHIRDYLKDRAFTEGYHYVRTPGGRKIMFIWERIQQDMLAPPSIPMAAGRRIYEQR